VLWVGAVVLAIHGIWIVAFLVSGHEVRDFIRIGSSTVTLSQASDVIGLDPTYDYPESRDAEFEGTGYDGQYAYFIAIDPGDARYYIDDPAYRYGRILYPMLARYAAAGDPDVVPWAMIIVNWLAVGIGTIALGALLARRGHSPWWALAFGLYPGLLIALQRDLTEVTAYALVAVAAYLFDYGGRRGVFLAGLAFGLAALSREVTLIFPALYGLSILAGRPNASDQTGARSPRQFLIFTLASFGPWLAWTAVLIVWLGLASRGSDALGLPLAGLLERPWSPVRQPVNLLFIGIPAMALALVAALGFRGGSHRLERFLLLANVLVAIVLASGAGWDAYPAMSRVATGVVVSAILCLPFFQATAGWQRRFVLGASGLALVILPVVLVYPFTEFQV